MIDGKPYQQHVVEQFYAVDGTGIDTQVGRVVSLQLTSRADYQTSDETL